uniref:Probable E3 SUMO-protein ligase RNF212 n=1 Tax=Castor canadensis TaxID=51338 RepID=A0A8B7VMK5_CASCN|nr:probable E3 SUMO-protein ligase RNF212 [Castor canadensis]
MDSLVFCNRCFQSPCRKSSFSLTNCGHVFCDVCLGKGKKDECLICKVPCRTVLLSKHTDSDIQTFFMRIDGLCKKYSKETSQVSEFQEKHRKRLLAFYREKISQLEESLRKSVLQIEQLQSMRSSQQTAFSSVKNSLSTKPNGYFLLPPNSSAPHRVESMEVDLTPSPVRKPEVAAGPTRISLISPPQDGRMGGVLGVQELHYPCGSPGSQPARLPQEQRVDCASFRPTRGPGPDTFPCCPCRGLWAMDVPPAKQTFLGQPLQLKPGTSASAQAPPPDASSSSRPQDEALISSQAL